MQEWICETCKQQRRGVRRRCYPCTTAKHTPESRERIRRALTGVRHPPERVKANSESHKGDVNRFDLAGAMQGRAHPRAREVGAERSNDQGRVFVKCSDGRWRRRAHLVWESLNGPMPRGRLIHHINEDPSDDRPENLQLVTRAEHAKIHMTLEKARGMQAKSSAVRWS